MKRRHVGAVSGVAVAALALALAPSSAQASAPSSAKAGASTSASTGSSAPTAKDASHAKGGDSLPNPFADAQNALRKDAVAKLLTGKATIEGSGKNRKIKIPGNTAPEARGTSAAKGKWVWYPTDREEDIFTILTDFGDKTMSATGGAAGPLHNQIPEPDRSENNSMIWQADYNKAHYQNLITGPTLSMKDFYLKQSQGRFTVGGDVSDWVQVPYNEARYGSNKIAQSDGYWNYVKDTAEAWYKDQVAQGKTNAQIKTYLARFDKWDRYDYDGDGNFNEPDGYIDHFQAVHAGQGEEAGGGAQGADAIWSHRWYAFSNTAGTDGPSFNKLGGVPLGDSGMWIGDYTTEPENGGLGVFSHEFGHDLGLADYYDTTNTAENSTGFWTLMSAGSWLSNGTVDTGSKPGYMGPHEKLLLGWLDYKVVKYGDKATTVKLGPANKDGQNMPQAIAVVLPSYDYTVDYNTPYEGDMEWWTGSGDNLNNSLTREIDLTGAASASISAMAQGETEAGYDVVYTEVSTDGGSTWTKLDDGFSGPVADWTKMSWDLSAYAGKKIDFRWRYQTDGGLAKMGLFLDNIALTVDGQDVWTDGAEDGDNGWTADGFSRMSGSVTASADRYYLAENRIYSDYDLGLRTGPYFYGWPDRPKWVGRFPYQNGMLVWAQDTRYVDNNTTDAVDENGNPLGHPGHGMSLPVDVHPELIATASGNVVSNRRNPFDATFGVEKTQAVTFYAGGEPVTLPARKGVKVFDDSNPNAYWSEGNPTNSVQVAGSGTKIEVLKSNAHGWTLDVKVSFTK